MEKSQIEANYIKQREGKWIRPRPFLPCHCSECLTTYIGRGETPAYCPDCEAKMIKEN